MLKSSSRCLLSLALVFAAVRSGYAEGRILIQSPGQAAAAVSGGELNPVSSANPQSIAVQQQFSGTPVGSTTLSTNTGSSAAFFTNTTPSPPSSNAPTSGGWTYAYGVDPDLTGYVIDIEFTIPQLFDPATGSGVQDIGIALSDSTNHIRLWTWDTSALTQGVQDFDFSVEDSARKAGATSLFDNGLDLTHVEQLQFSYDGVLTPLYPLDPTGQAGLWTEIDHVAVTPEPDARLALALGLLGMAGWSSYRRRRHRGEAAQ
jgi:hypothetical protein